MKTLIFAAGLLLSAAAPAQPPAEAPLPKPAWLGKEPLVIVGNWDSMPIFRRRVGGTPLVQEDDYVREHTEEAVLKLKELGVTMGVIHFYKGYGLEAEKEHMADARRLADLLHKHGLRVGVYVGSTIAYETFLSEKPEAREWFVERYLGRPVVYGDQTFRKRVYFMHPGYREYMKRVLRIAVQDFKADLIHFDNTSLQAQPPIFHHPLAVQDFRSFLRKKYTPDQLKRRFGFSDMTFVEPPELERTPAQINDPMHQEWADFRCAQLTAYYAEMERYIRGLNPETAVESNPHSGISGRNVVWEQGVDYPRFLKHMDVVWSEEGNEAGVNRDGILISKIRTYKMAAKLNASIFTYTGGGRGGELAMAEAMMFNRQNLGMVGGALAGYELPDEQRRYVRWYRDNFQYYRDIETRSEVAVLHNYASMAFNHDAPWQSSMLFQQALIHAKIPFDIVFDEHLRDLSKYKVLVLPDQEALSDAGIALIRDYVQRGGSVVYSGATAALNEERRRRRAPGLTAGGKIFQIASVQPAIPKPPAAGMTSQYWKLPLNWQELVRAVQTAAGTLSLNVQGPRNVAAEVTSQKGRTLVHLLNYEEAPVKENITVDLRTGAPVKRVTLISPDHAPRQLSSTMVNGAVRFTIPEMKIYEVAVLE